MRSPTGLSAAASRVRLRLRALRHRAMREPHAQNVGWQQAQRQPVRDVKNDRLVDPRPSAEAVDVAATTARGTSDACIAMAIAEFHGCHVRQARAGGPPRRRTHGMPRSSHDAGYPTLVSQSVRKRHQTLVNVGSPPGPSIRVPSQSPAAGLPGMVAGFDLRRSRFATIRSSARRLPGPPRRPAGPPLTPALPPRKPDRRLPWRDRPPLLRGNCSLRGSGNCLRRVCKFDRTPADSAADLAVLPSRSAVRQSASRLLRRGLWLLCIQGQPPSEFGLPRYSTGRWTRKRLLRKA